MWEELKKIALLGTDNLQLDADHIDILKRFGLDTNKAEPLIVLDAISLWNKMKSVGLPLMAWNETIVKAQVESPISSSNKLSSLIGVALKYNGFEKLLPEILDLISSRGIEFPSEHIPTILTACQEDFKTYEVLGKYFNKRFLWLAAQNKSWKFTTKTGNVESINSTKLAQEKLHYIQLWLKGDPNGLYLYLMENVEMFSEPFLVDIISLLWKLNSPIKPQLSSFLHATLDKKNKRSFGYALNVLMRDDEEPLTNSLIKMISDIIAVTDSEVSISEKFIQKLKSIIPKSMLPFPQNKNKEKAFDRNLLFQALSICPPSRLFNEHFQMKKDDFLSTIAQLEFFDDLILQALIYSASFHADSNMMSSLHPLFLEGEYQELNWSPMLDLLDANILAKEFIRLDKIQDGEIDLRISQIFLAENFHWPARAVQFYTDELTRILNTKAIGRNSIYYTLFERMCLRCNPNFYHDLKNEFLGNNIFTFQSNKQIEKSLNLLKIRYQFITEMDELLKAS